MSDEQLDHKVQGGINSILEFRAERRHIDGMIQTIIGSLSKDGYDPKAVKLAVKYFEATESEKQAMN